MAVRVKIVAPDGVEFKQHTAGSAGFDLAALEGDFVDPHCRLVVRTGVRLAIDPMFFGLIQARSSWQKQGLFISGVIDSDYRGEIFLSVWNLGTERVTFNAGDRLAQIIFLPACSVEVERVKTLDTTERGEGGFGSTG